MQLGISNNAIVIGLIVVLFIIGLILLIAAISRSNDSNDNGGNTGGNGGNTGSNGSSTGSNGSSTTSSSSPSKTSTSSKITSSSFSSSSPCTNKNMMEEDEEDEDNAFNGSPIHHRDKKHKGDKMKHKDNSPDKDHPEHNRRQINNSSFFTSDPSSPSKLLSSEQSSEHTNLVDPSCNSNSSHDPRLYKQGYSFSSQTATSPSSRDVKSSSNSNSASNVKTPDLSPMTPSMTSGSTEKISEVSTHNFEVAANASFSDGSMVEKQLSDNQELSEMTQMPKQVQQPHHGREAHSITNPASLSSDFSRSSDSKPRRAHQHDGAVKL